MKKVHIWEPLRGPKGIVNQPSFYIPYLVFTLIIMYVSINNATEDSSQIVPSILISLAGLYIIYITLVPRIRSKKKSIVISDSGIHIPFDINKSIPWKKVDNLYITYVIDKEYNKLLGMKNLVMGYPFLLIKLTNKSESVQKEIFDNNKNINIPFVVKNSYFEKFAGYEDIFDFGINIENPGRLRDYTILSENFPTKLAHLKPFAQVIDKQEYEKLIKHYKIPNKETGYRYK